MKKIKILIVVIIILIISIAVLLINIKNTNNNNNNEIETNTELVVENYEENTQEIIEDISRNNFFTVNTCLQNYYSYIQEENKEIMDEEAKREAIYELLDEYYIESNNITKDNILEKGVKIDYSNAYNSRKMYMKSVSELIDVYYVIGRIIDYTMEEEVRDVYNIVVLDKANTTFAIIPSQNYTKNEIKEELNKIKIENIKANENNKFKYTNVTDDSIAKMYFSNYIKNAIYDTELAYDYIDREYKQKRFPTLEEYKEYIDKNKETLKTLALEKYQINDKESYNEYVCVNSRGGYYIFKETDVMQYTILLDTYTVNIPEFTEKYDKANEQMKVAYNIEKIITAINNYDFEYVYEKMDKIFRENNFSTLEAFEEKTEFLFFDKNSVEYNEYEKKGNTHIYNITLKDYNGEIEHKDNIQIYMQLKDNYDFVFSFTI